MSSFSYSKANNLNNKFHRNNIINHMKFTELYLLSNNINESGDNVSISFTNTLTSHQQNILNSLITNYNNAPINYSVIPSRINVEKTSSILYYSRITSLYIQGEYHQSIQSIKIIAYMQNGNTSYDVKIYDVNNNKVIAEKNFTNTTEDILDMGSLSNLPYKETIFEVQVKSNKNRKDVYIQNIILNYYK